MAFTFTINSHTYTSDPTNTGVAAEYHFDGYNYMTALGNLAVDIVAVAAAVVASAAAALVSENAAAASAASAAALAGAFVGTSTTSWTPAVGSQAFVTQAGEQYTPNIFLMVVSASTPTAWGFGQVSSYAGTTLTMDIQYATGSGAHTDWNISLVGPRGPEGPAFTGGSLTTGFNEARGSVAMHATTMDLWSQPNIIDGTGSPATVTAIVNAPQEGARRTVYPPAGSIITNGATFAVDGEANHTAAAGDKWEFEAITISTYKVHVTQKSGLPTVAVPGASRVWIKDVTGTNSASVDVEWTNDAAYEDIDIELISVTNQTLNQRLTALFKVNGAYNNSNNYYTAGYDDLHNGGAITSIATGTASVATVGYLTHLELAAVATYPYARLHGTLTVSNPAGTDNYKGLYGELTFETPFPMIARPYLVLADVNAGSSVAAMTGVRFAASSGNLPTYIFRVWGKKKTT